MTAAHLNMSLEEEIKGAPKPFLAVERYLSNYFPDNFLAFYSAFSQSCFLVVVVIAKDMKIHYFTALIR
jgi:hypothetical protein